MTKIYELVISDKELKLAQKEKIERERQSESIEESKNSAIQKLKKLGLTESEIAAFMR